MRINCATILKKIKDIKFKDTKINNEINNIIENFKKDSDPDVVKAINGIL